jgi:hypothetical protein
MQRPLDWQCRLYLYLLKVVRTFLALRLMDEERKMQGHTTVVGIRARSKNF